MTAEVTNISTKQSALARDLSLTIKVSDDQAAVRIVQITDCHLGRDVGERLVGMDTDESLDHVLALLKAEQQSASLLLATGDLSNHGSSEAYQRLANKLQDLPMPSAWLAGNHDSRDLMVESVGEQRLPRTIHLANWLIVMLDSTLPGKVGGTLGAKELALAEQILQANTTAEHVMVCVHHQPVSIGCEWLDEQQITDSDDFIAMLAKEPRLRAVMWGHVHQAFHTRDARLPNVELFSAPSTCIQFAPNSSDFQLDQCSPGYRWLDLHRDGRVETDVSRITGIDLQVDFESSGY